LKITASEKHIKDAAHDDEEVKLVPGFSQIRAFIHDEADGDELNAHFEDEAEVEEQVDVRGDYHDQRVFFGV
jgi:hypothetical protein